MESFSPGARQAATSFGGLAPSQNLVEDRLMAKSLNRVNLLGYLDGDAKITASPLSET